MLKLKERRIQQAMTQEQLAELVGVTYQAISHYESGRRFPNRETLLKIAKALNCTVDEII